jgi:hypothetical protein
LLSEWGNHSEKAGKVVKIVFSGISNCRTPLESLPFWAQSFASEAVSHFFTFFEPGIENAASSVRDYLTATRQGVSGSA